ncbi:MAG TPA: hypothetical protein VGN11_05025 [Candidatus Baltobacteraceae bacterium]|jgi:hypothetical protein|nr:hypothetical protein [Candidatus Baltobacteraceae bacterium]
MSRFKRFAPLGLVFALAGCGGSPTGLRVGGCAVEGGALAATLSNVAGKPATEAEIVADFYRDYRFMRVVGETRLAPVLDPGESRHVTVSADVPNVGSAAPMHCTVTYAAYGDGTAEGARVGQ